MMCNYGNSIKERTQFTESHTFSQIKRVLFFCTVFLSLLVEARLFRSS